MNAKEITGILMRRWIGDRVALPNYRGNGSCGESDLFLVTKSAYCEEVEIKVSLADFRREFRSKTFKHGCLTGAGEYRDIAGNPLYLFPRRYWFAVPSVLADQIEKELRGPYGLLEITQSQVIERVKPRAIRCARKLSLIEMVSLAKCMTFRIARQYKLPE